jgi:hypothetical protein
MKWKEFLKPSKSKIILTLILLLIFPLPYWNGTLCERCDVEPCPSCPDTNSGPALIGWWLTWGDSFSGHAGLIGWHNQAINVLSGILLGLLIIGLPISYFLSCLIIFTYNRFRGKKK